MIVFSGVSIIESVNSKASSLRCIAVVNSRK